jgi:hypothetical protein
MYVSLTDVAYSPVSMQCLINDRDVGLLVTWLLLQTGKKRKVIEIGKGYVQIINLMFC